jgi:hypothetical protein
VARNEDIRRRDKVWAHEHYSTSKALSTETTEERHPPQLRKMMREHDDVTALWTKGAETERQVLAKTANILTERKKDASTHTDTWDRNVT